MANQADDKDLKFEQALKILEDIGEKLNNESIPLDEMLVLYEQGIHYLKLCREKLADVEMKVEILNEKLNKELPREDENG